MRSASVTQPLRGEVRWEKCRTGGTNSKRSEVVSEQKAVHAIKRMLCGIGKFGKIQPLYLRVKLAVTKEE